jgi:hypothetical protein
MSIKFCLISSRPARVDNSSISPALEDNFYPSFKEKLLDKLREDREEYLSLNESEHPYKWKACTLNVALACPSIEAISFVPTESKASQVLFALKKDDLSKLAYTPFIHDSELDVKKQYIENEKSIETCLEEFHQEELKEAVRNVLTHFLKDQGTRQVALTYRDGDGPRTLGKWVKYQEECHKVQDFYIVGTPSWPTPRLGENVVQISFDSLNPALVHYSEYVLKNTLREYKHGRPDDESSVWTKRILFTLARNQSIFSISFIPSNSNKAQMIHVIRKEDRPPDILFFHHYVGYKFIIPAKTADRVFDLSKIEVSKAVANLTLGLIPAVTKALDYLKEESELSGLALTLESQAKTPVTYVWLKGASPLP